MRPEQAVAIQSPAEGLRRSRGRGESECALCVLVVGLIAADSEQCVGWEEEVERLCDQLAGCGVQLVLCGLHNFVDV